MLSISLLSDASFHCSAVHPSHSSSTFSQPFSLQAANDGENKCENVIKMLLKNSLFMSNAIKYQSEDFISDRIVKC